MSLMLIVTALFFFFRSQIDSRNKTSTIKVKHDINHAKYIRHGCGHNCKVNSFPALFTLKEHLLFTVQVWLMAPSWIWCSASPLKSFTISSITQRLCLWKGQASAFKNKNNPSRMCFSSSEVYKCPIFRKCRAASLWPVSGMVSHLPNDLRRAAANSHLHSATVTTY